MDTLSEFILPIAGAVACLLILFLWEVQNNGNQ